MSIRQNVYGIRDNSPMTKQALGQTFATIGTDFAKFLTDLGTTASVWLLALSAGTGIGIGYGASALTAHGKQDIETAKKEYENQRLKADLGYLQNKVNEEYKQAQNKYKPKPARVIA